MRQSGAGQYSDSHLLQVATDIDGVPVNLSIYSGKVTLIVNVASQ